jgi:hypothetical protein
MSTYHRPLKARRTDRESKVQSSIRVRLRRLGIVLHRRNVAGFSATHNGKSRWIQCGRKGQADLYGWEIKTGRHWEIETKRDGNKPTENQLEWLKECGQLGAIAFWADDANVAERVAEAILAGGHVAWREGCDFDVEMD